MAKDVSIPVGDDYRGVAILSPEFVHDNLIRSTVPTFTEANPRPGIAVASAKSGMVVDVSGKMKAVATLRPQHVLTTNKGGHPGGQDGRWTFSTNLPQPVDHETEFGWDAPTAIARNELVYYSVNTPEPAGCIRLQTNDILWAVVDNGDLFIFKKRFDEAGYAATGAVKWLPWVQGVKVDEDLTRYDIVPGTACFFQVPNGRIHLYYMAEDTAVLNQGFGQVVHRWSDDNGASWEASDKYILDASIDMRGTVGAGQAGYDITRMRVAYSNGQALLLIAGAVHDSTAYATIRNAFWQYASDDIGTSFRQQDIADPAVGNTDGALLTDTATGSSHIAGFHDVVAAADGSGFVVAYARAYNPGSGTGAVTVKRLGSAFDNWLDVPATSVSGGTLAAIADKVMTETNVSIAVDETGVMAITYLGSPTAAGAASATKGKCATLLSYDHGATWLRCVGSYLTITNPADISNPWWYSGDLYFWPSNWCSTFQCGRLVVLTQFVVGGEQSYAIEPTKLWEIDLGSYSTTTRAFKASEESDERQQAWDVTYIPAETMATAGWTVTGAGAETLQNDGTTRLSTGAGQVARRESILLATPAAGYMAINGIAEFSVETGSITLFIADTSSHFLVTLDAAAGTIVVYDVTAGAAVYTDTDIDPTNFVQVCWGIEYQGRVNVWLRASANDTEARVWKFAVDGVALVAGVAGPFVAFGIPENTIAYVRGVAWGSGIYGRPLARGPSTASFVDTIYGRAWSPYPVHVHAGEGVRVAAIDGPSWDGDYWTITQRHEFGMDNVFPDVAASPRKTWRSDTVVGVNIPAQSFVVRVGRDNDPAPWLGRVLCVGGFNANFHTLGVNYRTNSGAGWTSLGVLSFRDGMTGLSFVRDGKMVQPSVGFGNTAGQYLTYNILEDSHISLTATAIRKIDTNAEGAWRPDGLRTRLYCKGIDGTEAANGNQAAIWSKDAVVLIRDCPDIYELQFTIPAGRTATGYFELGTLFVGHVAYFGRQYARGRALSLVPNYSLTTGRSGARRAQSLGPARRGIEFSWANENETDQTQIASSTPDPDYILPATGGAYPVASPADTALKMQGLIEYLRGATSPLVYLSKIPMVANENADTTLVNRNLFLLGRVMSDSQAEAVLGSEWSSTAGEVVRLSKILVEEEV